MCSEIAARMSDAAQDQAGELEKLMNKKQTLQHKRQDLENKIRDLGSLPSDAFGSHGEKSKKVLLQLQDKVQRQLKKFSHVNKLVSYARVQQCIFCDSWVRSPTFHVLCRCQQWDSSRVLVWGAIGAELLTELAEQVRLLMSIGPDSCGFKEMVEWASLLDVAQTTFWRD